MKIYVLEFLCKNEIVGIYPDAFKRKEDAEAKKEELAKDAAVVELTLE